VDYSRLAADYDEVRGDEAVDRAFWLPALREAGRLRAGDRILEIGAGTGRYARLLAEFARVVALDASRAMLAWTRGKGSFDRVLGDAHRLPFSRDAFDAVVAVMVLHQLDDMAVALREAARVSRRIAIATTDIPRRDLGVLAEAFPSLLAIDSRRFPRIEEIVSTLEAAGCRDVRTFERLLRRSLPVPKAIDRVRRKYISTLDLIPPPEFEHGLAFLEREMPRRYGDVYEFESSFTFVGASR
jgi:SAM-dependent methyltransferase